MKLHAQSFSFELEPARSVDTEDWVRVRAAAAGGVFSGTFEAFLQLGDLKRFKREIELMYGDIEISREAMLSCREPGIRIRLMSERMGGVAGTYQFQSEDNPHVQLSGSFRIDQSYLPELAAGTEELITSLSTKDVV